MAERPEKLRQKQRDAIWKWRWLGMRDSTPGFKGSLILLAVAIMFIALHLAGVL